MRSPPARCGLALTTIALLIEASIGAHPAHADDDTAIQLERVEVTGSRIRRIEGEAALPVQILRREDIERSGAQSAEDLLAQITANAASQPEALSIGNSSNPGFSGASLRGLGSTRTLVLLDGRRLANYAFSDQLGSGVDLHAIPLEAIDRVEVLRDGASAIYGTDAIGGVINFILKNDFRGAEASVYQGDSQQGGGSRTRTTATLGFGDPAVDRFNAFAVFDYKKQGELAARDRSFSSTDYRPSEGFDTTSNSSFPANIHIGGPVFANPAAPACTAQTVYARGGCVFDPAKVVDLLPPTEQWSVLGRGTFAIDANHDLYVEALYDRSRVRSIVAPAPVGFFTTDGDAIVLPTTSSYYPTNLGLSGDITDLRYRTSALGPRISDALAEQGRLVIGTKGAAGAWDYDTALTFNESRTTNRYISGYVSATGIADALASGLINPFGDSGPAGDALLASTSVSGIARRATAITRGVDAHASRDLFGLPAGPLSMAVGVDARRESLSENPTTLGMNVAGDDEGSSVGGQRSVEAAYLELSVPVAKGLDAQLALRDDHYSDFGSTLNPKVALRWQPVDALLLRASYGRGFRAPSLPELFTSQDTEVDFVFDPTRCPAGDCGDVASIRTGGNPALKPEHSEQASAGIVFEPNRHLSASVDFWRIRVTDQIAELAPDYLLANDSTFEGKYILRGPVDPAYPTLPGPITELLLVNANVGTSITRGFDVDVAAHSEPTPVGSFSASLTGTYVQEAKSQLTTPEYVNLRAAFVNGGVVPRWHQFLSFGWKYASFTTTLQQSQQTGYDDGVDATGHRRRAGGYQTWNAQLSYAGIRDTTLTLGVQNLFDRDPPFTIQSNYFQGGYDPAIADPRGRFFYGRIAVRWP